MCLFLSFFTRIWIWRRIRLFRGCRKRVVKAAIKSSERGHSESESADSTERLERGSLQRRIVSANSLYLSLALSLSLSSSLSLSLALSLSLSLSLSREPQVGSDYPSFLRLNICHPSLPVIIFFSVSLPRRRHSLLDTCDLMPHTHALSHTRLHLSML